MECQCLILQAKSSHGRIWWPRRPGDSYTYHEEMKQSSKTAPRRLGKLNLLHDGWDEVEVSLYAFVIQVWSCRRFCDVGGSHGRHKGKRMKAGAKTLLYFTEGITFGSKLSSNWARMPSHVRWYWSKSWIDKDLLLVTKHVAFQRITPGRAGLTTKIGSRQSYRLMWSFSMSDSLHRWVDMLFMLTSLLLSWEGTSMMGFICGGKALVTNYRIISKVWSSPHIFFIRSWWVLSWTLDSRFSNHANAFPSLMNTHRNQSLWSTSTTLWYWIPNYVERNARRRVTEHFKLRDLEGLKYYFGDSFQEVWNRLFMSH